MKGYTNITMIYVLIYLAMLVGWVVNIIKIVNTINHDITGMFVFRCVGIILFPVGSILGFL